MTDLPLGPGAEFDRIRALATRLGGAASGLGDDAAVVPMGGTNLVASIDCSVEGVHFRTDWMTFYEIGARAVGAALSDLAAEGARVIGVLVSVGARNEKRETGSDDSDPVVEIMAGVGDLVASVGGKVLGGDLVKSDKYLVDVCVLGEAQRPVTRGGAQAGDGIWVTGSFGAPGAALEALSGRGKPSDRHVHKFTHVRPQIEAGLWLAAHGAHAMIDVSDGLAADLGHVAAASGVAIGIDGNRVPLATGVTTLAALASGEEYELAVALPASFGLPDAEAFRSAVHEKLTRIGEVKAGAGVEVMIDGRPARVPAGFDHFRK